MALFIYLFTALWLFLWVYCNVQIFNQKKNYYRFAVQASLSELQESHFAFNNNSKDFYKILRFCNHIIPDNKELQLILPTENNVEFLWLREKARYFLYPKNYGDNSVPKDYILVYRYRDFITPPNYKMIRSFGPHEYLLKKIISSTNHAL